MQVVAIPLGVYCISALLLYIETILVSGALERARGMAYSPQRTIALIFLLFPLALFPVVPVVFLLTLDYDGRADIHSYASLVLLWIGGLLAALPSYFYLTRHAGKRTS
jgi:hypothetical protein